MSRAAAGPLPSFDASGAAPGARRGPADRPGVVRRRLAAHAVLAASALLVLDWPLVTAWLALAVLATLAAEYGRRPGNRLPPRILPAGCVYGAPTALALLAALFGGAWGLVAAGYVSTALAVNALGQGHLRALSRRIGRRRSLWRPMTVMAESATPPRPRSIRPTPARTTDSGQTMRTLLADLLDLSRLDQGRLEVRATAFDLRALIAATVGDWRPEARRKGLAFALSGADKAPRWVEGDPIRIRQILDTLIANALKFTTVGSIKLTVGAEPRPDGRVALTLSVLDSGPGMTGEQIAGLFDRHDRSNPSVRPAGLVLARYLARELARLMGGDLTVTSAPGLGAAFSLSLSMALAAGGAGHVDTARGLRVLVVDDHAVYRQAFSLILQTVCRDVVCAQDGIEALDLLSRESFDLVLMDLVMPRLGGVAVTRRLRTSSSRGRDVAIIALTAADSDEDRAACLAAGMNGFVSKPVDARELLSAIHAVLSGEAVSQAA